MNLKLPTHLVTSLKLLNVHLVSKQTNIHMRKYGLKNPVDISNNKFKQH